MKRKPTPLAHDAAVPRAQRELLALARRTSPARYDVNAGAARFVAALKVASSATMPAAASVRRAGSFAKLKLALLVLPVGLLVFMGDSWRRGSIHDGVPARRASVDTHDEFASALAKAAPRQELSVISPTILRAPPEQGGMSEGPKLSPRARQLNLASEPERVRRSRRAHPTERAYAFGSGEQRAAASSVAARASGPSATTQSRATRASATQSNVEVERVSVDDTSVSRVDAKLEKNAPADRDRQAPVRNSAPIDELQAIATARRLVASSPRAALTLLAQVEQQHPRGYFVEEREALTVVALFEAGERKLAERQAVSFLQRHPQSPYASRIRERSAR